MNTPCSFVSTPARLRLAYAQQGDRNGPVVLMLHGYAHSHRSFDLLRPHLPEALRAIALTQRGHGASDKPETGYAMADLRADLEAFVDALEVGRAHLVGHSMGAALALAAAAARPERVASLTLIGGFACCDLPTIADLAAAVAELQDAVDPEFALAFQESAIHHMIPQRFLEAAVRESLRCPPHVWRSALRGWIEAQALAAARVCQAPVLLMRGEHDRLAPAEHQIMLRDALASARVLSVPGAGHAPHWERPEAVAAMLCAFVCEIEEPAIAYSAFA